MICPIPSGRWQILLAFLNQTPMKFRKDAWTRQKDLCTANHAAKTSRRNIQFFHLVTPTASPSIMGPEEIHSIEALCRWHGLLYYPWCAKEGQNEGTMANHLCTVHYCLGLVCTLCLAFFTTSVETIRKHGPSCKCLCYWALGRGRDTGGGQW